LNLQNKGLSSFIDIIKIFIFMGSTNIGASDLIKITGRTEFHRAQMQI
jgi:hypothetical protein